MIVFTADKPIPIHSRQQLSLSCAGDGIKARASEDSENSLLLGRESNALRWRVEEIAPYVYFSSIRSQAKPPRSFTVQFGFRSLASARHPSNEHRLVVLAFLATSFTIHWFADLSDSFPTSIQEAISVTHEKSKSYQLFQSNEDISTSRNYSYRKLSLNRETSFFWWHR